MTLLVGVIPQSGIDDDYVGKQQSSSPHANDVVESDDVSIIRDSQRHQLLQSSFSFPLDEWQLEAGCHILDDRNVIVCAPTGAGKTVVGEMALRIALERNKRAIYTTPLKALSNQKFGEMRGVFGVDRVGLATGDVSIRRGADVTIMTTEVYRNMAWRAKTGLWDVVDANDVDDSIIDAGGLESARSSSSGNGGDEYSDLSSNSIVVLDEFHYMGQKGRGSTWEECVIFNPMHTQIVGLSATLREFFSPPLSPDHCRCFFSPSFWGEGERGVRRGRECAEITTSLLSSLRVVPPSLSHTHTRSILSPTHTSVFGPISVIAIRAITELTKRNTANANRLAAWMESVTGRKSMLIEANDKRPVPLRYYFASKKDFAPLFRDELAGPGAPRGLLGLRGDGAALTPKMIKKDKRYGFDKNDSSLPRVNRNCTPSLPRGLDLNPTLQEAAERRSASIDRQIQRILNRASYDDSGHYGRESTISSREQRKMKENMLKAELRKSVPSIAILLRRLQEQDLLPAIFFIFSRKGCDNAAEILCENLKTKAQEKSDTRKRPVVERNSDSRGRMVKGKVRRRGRHPNGNDLEVNRDEFALVDDDSIFEDGEGRRFRADLLDQLLSDDYDSSMAKVRAVGVEDDSFLSETNLQYYTEIGLLTFEETKEVAARLLSFNTQNPEIAFSESNVETLLCGIGAHHAGILPAHKAFVETLFRVDLMKVVFATETLAAGINMPARTTVICSLAKRGDIGMELLETHNMLQMAGRAGRRGMDVEGACVIASTAFEGPEDAITILTNEIKPVVSQFSPSYTLAVNLIERGAGKLDVAKTMIQKSYGVWEIQQREEELRAALEGFDSTTNDLSPEENFLNTLQLVLEKELIEARSSASPTETSQSKLAALVEVLSDGKKLKKISKRYSGAAQLLELEHSTLQVMELELREMNSSSPDLPTDFYDSEKMELISEIKRQRQRVIKGQREVNGSILSAISKVANKRMRDEYDGSKTLSNALQSARLHGEDSMFSEGAPLEPGELNAYIKKSPKNNRGPILDQTTPIQTDESDEESWSQMQAIIKILEAYGCLKPSELTGEVDIRPETIQYDVTSGGEHVGSLGLDNSLWQLCALGGAWDVAYISSGLDRFQDSLADFEEEDREKEDAFSAVPKPQVEADALVNHLCQLSASEMAGYVSSLVVDAPRGSDSALVSFHKLTHPQQRAVQGALLSLERLVEVQRIFGLDEAVGKCQLELSACDVVTAWASGCSWNDALVISGAAPGDLVRTLSRALDALRQLGNLPYIPARALQNGIARLEATGIHPKVRSLCRDAANAMDRYPVKDMLPFEDDDFEESNDEVAEKEGEKDEEKERIGRRT
jgi:superfamily II RNA helicase